MSEITPERLAEIEEANGPRVILLNGELVPDNRGVNPTVLDLCAALRQAWKERDQWKAWEEERRVTMLVPIRDLAERAENAERERDEALALVAEMMGVLRMAVDLQAFSKEQWPVLQEAVNVLSLPAPEALARLTARTEAETWREAAKWSETEANAKAESVPDQWTAGQEHAYTEAMSNFLACADAAQARAEGK